MVSPLSPTLQVVSQRSDSKSHNAESISRLAPMRPRISLTQEHLSFLNEQLEQMHAVDILRFSRTLFPNLFQLTALGLTGLVTLDMLSRISADGVAPSIELIFLDTLYHFSETYQLLESVRRRYQGVRIHVFRPQHAATTVEFERQYGERIYDTAPERYDWVAKVETLQRAYAQLGVAAVLTGRRRSQGGARGRIPVLEVDEGNGGIVKINPLAGWTFDQVRAYVAEHDVPHNSLLELGYKSIGDWHSTAPVADNEDERDGRWRGQEKTECGIHNQASRYAKVLADRNPASVANADGAQQSTVVVA